MNQDIRDLLPDPLDISDLGMNTQVSLSSKFPSDLLNLVRKDGKLINHDALGGFTAPQLGPNLPVNSAPTAAATS